MSIAEEMFLDGPEVKPKPTGPEAEPPLTIIERRHGWRFLDTRELWRYRELLLFLTWRDIKVQYKQTVLGAAWALIQPLGTMAVFYFFLRDQGGNDEKIPEGFYPLFAFAGLLPWTFFGNAVSTASQSVVGNQNLVTKVYFPRMMIPMATVGARLVDFAVGAALLIALIVGYNLAGTPVTVGWSVLLLPVVVFLLAVAAIGVGAFLSALTVAYRDFRHVIPFLVQFWMFATPCIYRNLGPTWKPWLPINPAYGLILNFRWAVLGRTDDPDHALYALAVSGVVSVLLLVAGCLYFRRVERGFADVI